MLSVISRRLADEDGATMVEYALMLMLIAVVCVAAVTLIGGVTNGKFEQCADRWP